MKKGIMLINVVMLLCIIALSYKLYADWQHWADSHNEEMLLKKVGEASPVTASPKVEYQSAAVSQAAYWKYA